MKVCWDADEARASATVERLWPNEALPGELAQILPTPEHFAQAYQLVTEDMVAGEVPCGPDVERHVAAIQACVDAGVRRALRQPDRPRPGRLLRGLPR